MSDGVHDAYLADVIVESGSRGRGRGIGIGIGIGIGKLLMRTMVEDGPGPAFRSTLFTVDAHGLDEQFGFAVPDRTAMVRPGARAPVR